MREVDGGGEWGVGMGSGVEWGGGKGGAGAVGGEVANCSSCGWTRLADGGLAVPLKVWRVYLVGLKTVEARVPPRQI